MKRFEVKKIKVKGLRNTRDLGQLSDITQYKIKKNVLFRSSRLDKMSEKRRNKFLNDYNIKTVIDLRTDVEINEGKKIVFPPSITYIRIPILTKRFFGITHEKKMSKVLKKESVRYIDKVKKDEYLVEMYKSIVFDEESQKYFREFFDCLIEHKEGAILYHCTSGKDRTGIVTMFILFVLGINEQTIIEDYAASTYFNRSYIRTRIFLLKAAIILDVKFRRLLASMLYSKKEYLQKTIAAINDRYGSINNYLVMVLGLTEEKQAIIRKKLLEE